jgi:hypothetical protein
MIALAVFIINDVKWIYRCPELNTSDIIVTVNGQGDAPPVFQRIEASPEAALFARGSGRIYPAVEIAA